MGNQLQSHRVSPAVWDHTVLPDTGECVNASHINFS